MAMADYLEEKESYPFMPKKVHILISGSTTTKGNYKISKKKNKDPSKWKNPSYVGGMGIDILSMEIHLKVCVYIQFLFIIIPPHKIEYMVVFDYH